MTPDEKFQQELKKAVELEKILDQYNKYLDILSEKIDEEDYRNMKLLFNKYWKYDIDWRKDLK